MNGVIAPDPNTGGNRARFKRRETHPGAWAAGRLLGCLLGVSTVEVDLLGFLVRAETIEGIPVASHRVAVDSLARSKQVRQQVSRGVEGLVLGNSAQHGRRKNTSPGELERSCGLWGKAEHATIGVNLHAGGVRAEARPSEDGGSHATVGLMEAERSREVEIAETVAGQH